MRAVAAALALAAVLLSGCVTSRKATFTEQDYSTVFKGAVKGMCAMNKKFVVYKADEKEGKIYTVVRTMGHPKVPVNVMQMGSSTEVSITMQGLSPLPDLMIESITREVAAMGKSRGRKGKKEAVVESSDGPIRIAVSNLEAQNVSSGDAAQVSEMVRDGLVKNKGYRVLERSNMDKVLAEQSFQQAGCTSTECAVKLGKMLNVKRMVVGSFGKLMDRYRVTLRVVEVETGVVVDSESIKAANIDELEERIAEMTAKF